MRGRRPGAWAPASGPPALRAGSFSPLVGGDLLAAALRPLLTVVEPAHLHDDPAQRRDLVGAQRNKAALHEQRGEPERLGPVADVVLRAREPGRPAEDVARDGGQGE